MSKNDNHEEVGDSEKNIEPKDNQKEVNPKEDDSKDEDGLDPKSLETKGAKEDPSEKSEEPLKDYRTVKEAPEVKVGKETVPLSKYLAVKAKLKQASENSSTEDLTNTSLSDFAEEAGLSLEVVSKLASIITAQASEEASRKADERIKPIILERSRIENEKAFSQDFDSTIAKEYPDLIAKKEAFKHLAFSKEFLYLKTLEDIRKEFFPTASKIESKKKDVSLEKGSQGSQNIGERIDFATLKDHPDLYEKVMKDASARSKYYKWQDSLDE